MFYYVDPPLLMIGQPNLVVMFIKDTCMFHLQYFFVQYQSKIWQPCFLETFGGFTHTPVFWTPGNVYPVFQSQGGFPCLCASWLAHNIFFRFTSSATPTDLLATSMAVESFHPHTCTCIQTLVGLESGIKRAAASQHVTELRPVRRLFPGNLTPWTV